MRRGVFMCERYTCNNNLMRDVCKSHTPAASACSIFALYGAADLFTVRDARIFRHHASFEFGA